MNEQSYFIFSINQCRYGIDTAYVDEVFALPELTPTSKASRDIVGVVNFRETVLPVMDLSISLGHQSSNYRLTDSLVILKWEDLRVGIIVNAVHDIREISLQNITTEISQDEEWAGVERKKIIAGIIKNDGEIVILSNPGSWLWYSEIQQFMPAKESLTAEIRGNHDTDQWQSGAAELLTAQPIFCPNASPQEREIFRKRADNLKLPAQNQDLRDLKPLVVVALGDDFFGIDVEIVREFVDVRKVTPVPCCPNYIVGNMNLRGEILTLVDLRGLLNPSLNLTDKIEGSKAMVVEIRNIVAGIMVKEIGDTMFLLDQQEVMKVSDVRDLLKFNEKYLQGIAPYHDKVMTILDMHKIFFNSKLTIDEAV